MIWSPQLSLVLNSSGERCRESECLPDAWPAACTPAHVATSDACGSPTVAGNGFPHFRRQNAHSAAVCTSPSPFCLTVFFVLCSSNQVHACAVLGTHMGSRAVSQYMCVQAHDRSLALRTQPHPGRRRKKQWWKQTHCVTQTVIQRLKLFQSICLRVARV